MQQLDFGTLIRKYDIASIEHANIEKKFLESVSRESINVQ